MIIPHCHNIFFTNLTASRDRYVYLGTANPTIVSDLMEILIGEVCTILIVLFMVIDHLWRCGETLCCILNSVKRCFITFTSQFNFLQKFLRAICTYTFIKWYSAQIFTNIISKLLTYQNVSLVTC